MRRHAPWPLPFAAGVGSGALATTAGNGDLGATLVTLTLAALAGLAAATLLLSPRGAAAARTCVAVLLVALGAALGALRGHGWATAPDPWAELVGETVEIEGRSDGALLRVPGRGALVLYGADVPAGRATVRGTVEALPGKRNPGGVDLRAHWRRRGGWAALRVEEIAEASSRPGAREALRRGVVAGLSPDAAGLMQAMTLGVRDELGDLRTVFAASGLAHVLALSGLHVGVLAAAFALVTRPLGRGGAWLVPPALASYVAIVGPSPSVVRAATMVSAVAAAFALRSGPPATVAALALAAALGLLASPAWVADLAFALSYLSVLGIALLAPPLLAAVPTPRGRALRSLRLLLAGGAAVSVAAQLASASLVASTFGGLPLISPLANLAAVPLASLLVPAGFAAGVAGLLGEGAARAVNLLVGPLAETLIALARLAARAPSLPWGEVSWVGHACHAVGLGAVALALHRRLRPWRSALVVLVAAGVAAATPPPHATPELVALDVGQGDAIVVRVGSGQAVLVDGGGGAWGGRDAGERVVVPALRALGVRALPIVIATHADLDHAGGLAAVLRAFPVGSLWIGHREEGRPLFRELVLAAALAGVEVREVRRGESANVGRVRLDVVHPIAAPSGVPNDDSVAVVVRVDGVPWALLAGDVSADVEGDLPVPPVPVVLAPHHGSPSSTSQALLDATRPRLALVSVGRNRFGHPSPAVLRRLERSGVAVRTTLEEGALRVPYPPP